MPIIHIPDRYELLSMAAFGLLCLSLIGISRLVNKSGRSTHRHFHQRPILIPPIKGPPPPSVTVTVAPPEVSVDVKTPSVTIDVPPPSVVVEPAPTGSAGSQTITWEQQDQQTIGTVQVTTRRFSVPGGWLYWVERSDLSSRTNWYIHNSALAFVPKPS